MWVVSYHYLWTHNTNGDLTTSAHARGRDHQIPYFWALVKAGGWRMLAPRSPFGRPQSQYFNAPAATFTCGRPCTTRTGHGRAISGETASGGRRRGLDRPRDPALPRRFWHSCDARCHGCPLLRAMAVAPRGWLIHPRWIPQTSGVVIGLRGSEDKSSGYELELLPSIELLCSSCNRSCQEPSRCSGFGASCCCCCRARLWCIGSQNRYQ